MLVSDLITQALRESNLISLNATPTGNQQSEALGRLNSLILSTVGTEAGTEITDLPIGGSGDASSLCSPYVPANVRLVCDLSEAKTLTLDPNPYEGQRLAVVSASGNFDTCNLTLDGNGRNIESGPTKVLNLPGRGLNYQWLYRADTANWALISILTTADQTPLPTEFDDYLIIMLAKRLSPRYAQALAQESIAELNRQKNIIRARYRQRRPQQDLGTIGLMGQHGFDGSTASFNAGRAR